MSWLLSLDFTITYFLQDIDSSSVGVAITLPTPFCRQVLFCRKKFVIKKIEICWEYGVKNSRKIQLCYSTIHRYILFLSSYLLCYRWHIQYRYVSSLPFLLFAYGIFQILFFTLFWNILFAFMIIARYPSDFSDSFTIYIVNIFPKENQTLILYQCEGVGWMGVGERMFLL